MSISVYIFNPEHDLALANSDPNFNAPLSAQKLAADLAVVPLWFCEPESIIMANPSAKTWLKAQQQLFGSLKSMDFGMPADLLQIAKLVPWGWDKAICTKLSGLGMPTDLFPTPTELLQIKALSHRRVAAALSAVLKADSELAHVVPASAVELKTIAEVSSFVSQNFQVVVKAPLSGSGKGLNWVCKSLTESQLGWCRNIIAKQGSVMAESVYDKLQDFALLFSCQNSTVSFFGYSLFETDNGIYRSNALLSNVQIEAKLIALGISEYHLLHVRRVVSNFLSTQLAPHYTGMLGVDMFVYTQQDEVKLHASVEINLRTTMGVLSRRFYDHFVNQRATGQLFIDYNPDSQALYLDHKMRQSAQPLSVVNGRIVSGYFCASDINPLSQYRLRVEVATDSAF